MALPAPLDLKEWFNTNVEDFLGIAPTSTSPQPVHVLNGFFHTALTGRRAARSATDLVATKSGQWAKTADHVRARGSISLPDSDHDLLHVRRATAGLVATDRAVFSGNASFQLAHLGLVTSDYTHFRLGSLASRLALGPGHASDRLDALAHRLAEPQPNPHSAVQAVLAEPSTTDDWEVSPPAETAWWGTKPACSPMADELGGVLRRSLWLAGSTADSLLGLQTLGVAATWCGLVAFAQVPSFLVRGEPLPLLVEAGIPGELPTLRDSSARAFDDVQRAFATWLTERLVATVTGRFRGEEPSRQEAHEFLLTCRPYALSGGSKKSQERMPEIFDLWARDTGDTFRALGLAL